MKKIPPQNLANAHAWGYHCFEHGQDRLALAGVSVQEHAGKLDVLCKDMAETAAWKESARLSSEVWYARKQITDSGAVSCSHVGVLFGSFR